MFPCTRRHFVRTAPRQPHTSQLNHNSGRIHLHLQRITSTKIRHNSSHERPAPFFFTDLDACRSALYQFYLHRIVIFFSLPITPRPSIALASCFEHASLLPNILPHLNTTHYLFSLAGSLQVMPPVSALSREPISPPSSAFLPKRTPPRSPSQPLPPRAHTTPLAKRERRKVPPRDRYFLGK